MYRMSSESGNRKRKIRVCHIPVPVPYQISGFLNSQKNLSKKLQIIFLHSFLKFWGRLFLSFVMKNCVFSFPIVKDFLTNVKNEISGLFWYPVFGWLYGSNILYPAGYQIKKGGIIQLDFRCITNTNLIRNVYGAGILSKYLLRTFVRGLCWTMDMQLICRLERYL